MRVKHCFFFYILAGIEIYNVSQSKKKETQTGLIGALMSVHAYLGVKKLSVWRLFGVSTVHGLSLWPIMQQRCGD